MKRYLFSVVLLLFAASAFAQSGCPGTTLKLYDEKKELAIEGDKLPLKLSLVLQDKQTCPTKTNYEVVSGKLYLVRDNRPYGQVDFTEPQIDMSYWKNKYQPGDRIVIEITKANTVSETGEKKPYNTSHVANWRLK